MRMMAWLAKVRLWLTTPQGVPPPVPRDDNMRGLGWGGDRGEVRPFDPDRYR